MLNKYFLSCFLLFCFFYPRPSLAIEDGILAIVNDQVITIKDLRDAMKGVFSQLRIEGRSPAEIEEIMTQYETKGIQQLIEDRLVLTAAEQSGIIIKPVAIETKIREIESNYPSSQAFRDALLKEGLTITDLRKKISDQFKGQVVVENEVRAKIKINPQEVTAYFNSHIQEFKNRPRLYLNSIFVQKGLASESAKEKIEQAMDQVKLGRDFKEVLQEFSELPSVGEISSDSLRPELKDKVSFLNIGQVSEIIEMDNGYYIFKLEGRTPGIEASLSAEKDRIYQKIYQDKFRQRFREWIDGLRKKTYIEIKE
jgi:peptidyl-prolyl cis-trans isomerase SurA